MLLATHSRAINYYGVGSGRSADLDLHPVTSLYASVPSSDTTVCTAVLSSLASALLALFKLRPPLV